VPAVLVFGIPASGKTNANGTACFWLGDGADRMALVWPSGCSAHDSPLSLYDESRKLVASVGDRVALGGGLLPAGTTVLGCPEFSRAWSVGRVIAAT
jgi:hypothetical protein